MAMASIKPAVPAPSPNERIARVRALDKLRGTIGQARFTKGDSRYHPIRGEVTIGLWLLDRTTAERTASMWPIGRATLHWRRHDLVIHDALSYEFQIDQELPYATLTAAQMASHVVILRFANDLSMRVGVKGLRLTRVRSDVVRTDWGVRGWVIALPRREPVSAG